ncbi:MAG: long-chain-fatty-acid--CoA ligase [Campylobacterota bacterium]|nr:long-chain-fatty-acid--CoA ligase [Campylobacterota bacterium]
MNYKYQNFYQIVESNATLKPNAKIIYINDDKITNKELLNRVDSFAAYLHALGVKAGDRVALITPNSLEFVISLFAVSKLGAVFIGLNNQLTLSEYSYMLNDCSAKILITHSSFKKSVSDLQENSTIKHTIWLDKCEVENEQNSLFSDSLNTTCRCPKHSYNIDELAVIFYTSGTTGNPKGAMISYKNIFSNIEAGIELFNITKKDRFILYLPMYHAFTFSITMLLPIFAMSSIVIIPKLLPFSNIIKQTLLKRVTIFLGVPDVYNALIRADLPWYFLWFNSIRLFVSGASPLSEDTLNKFNSIFKRAKMLEGYGLSECSPAVAINPQNLQKPLSIGKALKGYEVKIVDRELVEVPRGEIGELIIHGDCVMLGYLNYQTSTQETIINGWLRSGDLGYMDSDDYIFIVDRKKDIIINKGVNIYPREIEEKLSLIPQIKAAAVIGIEDEKSGEVPVAYIELEENQELDAKEVRAILKESLATFKLPKHYYFIDELPKNATGKVMKRVLKESL